MIGNYTRSEKSRDLEPAVAVGGDHHGDLDALVVESGDAAGPFSFDRGPTLELEAQLSEKRDGIIEGFDDDADIAHS